MISNTPILVLNLLNFWINNMDSSVAGLLLVGGKSRRMGRDKGKLSYRGVSQRMYAYALLEAVCGKVFFSCNPAQEEGLKNFPFITDQYPNQGPLGGILSAFERYPKTSFMVLACDMPNIDVHTLRRLLAERKPASEASVLQHPQTGQLEPLCAIWEASCLTDLKRYWDGGGRKLIDLLGTLEVATILIENPQILENVNTYQEYLAYK